MREWTVDDAASRIAVPGADADKYARGVLGAVVGSERYPGAAVLGVEAAHRTGIGMVRLVSATRAEELVLARRPEVVLGDGRCDAWLIGSGQDASLRTREERAALLGALRSGAPVVIDAGALDLLADARGPVVATPHHGELARLLAARGHAVDAAGVGADTARWAVEAARATGAVVLAKGARTLVASPDGAVIAPPETPHWLATAGTGDVLAGILGALVATHADAVGDDAALLAELAATAATLHGLAAERASRGASGEPGGPGGPGGPIAALDVAAALPATIAALLA